MVQGNPSPTRTPTQTGKRRELQEVPTTTTTTTTTITIYVESGRMLNISWVVTVPTWASHDVEQRAEDITNDISFLNETLWDYLVAQGVDPALAEWYDITGFMHLPAEPKPVTQAPTVKEKRPAWREGMAMAFLLFCGWFAIFLLARRSNRKKKMTNWTRKNIDSKKLTVCQSIKSFHDFCAPEGAVVHLPPKKQKKFKIKHKCRRYYLSTLMRLLETVFITGWRFVLGFGLWSLSLTLMVRAARWAESEETGERYIQDATIDANLAGCAAILDVILPLSCFMVGLFLLARLLWLHKLLDIADGLQRSIKDVGLIAHNVLPHTYDEDVAKVKWLLYRYLCAFHLFALAKASPHLKSIVHDELLSAEAFSKCEWMTAFEEEEVVNSEARAGHILIWVSHLLMEIGRACDGDRPCALALTKLLALLRTRASELAIEMERATPVSFLQMLYLMADFTVLLTPLGLMHMTGADHEGYSIYTLPCVCTMLVCCCFHGSLRLIDEASDPFGAHLDQDHGTNRTLQDTEHKLFSMLALWEDETEVPLPRITGDLEPKWADNGLGWTFPVTADEETQGLLRSSYSLGQQQLHGLGTYDPIMDKFVPAEGHDDDFMSVDAASLQLSDVDRTEFGNINNAVLNDYRRRPPVFNPEGRGGVDMQKELEDELGLIGITILEEEKTKAKLLRSETEANELRSQLKITTRQLLHLRATSVSTKDAEEILELLAEWIAPPRPVRLSDVTLAKLAEISRRQSTKVKKILTLSARQMKEGKLQGISKPVGVQVAEVGAAKASADYKRLIGDLMERLDEENQVGLRLKAQLTEASTVDTNIGHIPMSVPRQNSRLRMITDQSASGGALSKAATDVLVSRNARPRLSEIERQASRGLTKDGRLK
jgi:hypothetical protein